MLTVNDRKTRGKYHICSINTPNAVNVDCSGIVIANFERILHFILGLLLVTLSMYLCAGRTPIYYLVYILVTDNFCSFPTM